MVIAGTCGTPMEPVLSMVEAVINTHPLPVMAVCGVSIVGSPTFPALVSFVRADHSQNERLIENPTCNVGTVFKSRHDSFI